MPRPAQRILPAFVALLNCALASSTVVAAGTDPLYRLEIPSQPLASALNSLALQSDSQILFEQAPVSGLRAPSVSGEMPVDQALRELLTGTDLEAVRNPDGTRVVRSRPHIERTAQRIPVARADTRATAALPVSTSREMEQPWSIRARGVYRDFGKESHGLEAHDAWAPEFGAEYHFTPHVSTELAVSPERSHSLRALGTVVDDLHVSAQFLTLKYGFQPESVFRPYVGIGVSRIHLSGVDSTLPALGGSNWAPLAQAGADLRLGRGWFLNADVRYARLRPNIRPPGAGSDVRMKMDPLFLGIGFSYRFSRTVIASVPAIPVPAPVRAPLPPAEPVAVAPPPPPPPADSDHDGVRDDRDRCPATPPAFRVDAEGCEIDETILAGVTFRTDSAVLADGAQTALDPVVAALKLRPGAVAEVRGYTDDRGPAEYNQQLSDRRAAAVAEFLRRNGANEAQIRSRGEGESMPIASNATEEGRASNRRVTIRFTRAQLK